MFAWTRASGAVGTVILISVACTTDPKVEDHNPSLQGGRQPPSESSATLTVQEACDRIVAAETAARDDLGCDAPEDEPSCPAYLYVAGALPCDAVLEDTVAACEQRIGGYRACEDFAATPCVVTVDSSSCGTPAPPVSADGGPGGSGGTGGGTGGAGGAAGGGGVGGGAGAPMEGGAPDGSSDASMPMADAATDGTVPVDAPSD